jgi:hypothetical protein
MIEQLPQEELKKRFLNTLRTAKLATECKKGNSA